MLCAEVNNYIEKAQGLPFFYVVGDNDYLSVLDELKQKGLKVIRLSDFCNKNDKFPDIDDVIDSFRTGDIDYRDNKYVLTGLGEYLALRGTEETTNTLMRLKSTTLGSARVVLLLRGVSMQATAVIEGDKKLQGQKRAYSVSDCLTNLSVTNFKKDNGLVEQKGVKWLLRDFEDGITGNCRFSSMLDYSKSILPIRTVADAFDALKYLIVGFSIPKEYGTDAQWSQLLDVLNRNKGEISAVFEKYGAAEDLASDIYEKVNGFEFKNWLYFISLKVNASKIQNSYLRAAIDATESFDSLKKHILSHITEYSHTDKRFMRFYNERKKLVRGFPESDIAIFLNENAINPQEAIFRYTDNTLTEKRHVIKWVAQHGWDKSIAYVYPALEIYLKKYIFDCGSLSETLTTYFEQYKIQKLENRLDDDFIKLVDEYGDSLKYAKLQTRDNVIKAIENKNTAFLYWIDALGVEYLAYFTELARKKGLSMHVEIARADLPTITPINKDFYDQWSGVGKYKEEALDDIKHSDKGGYFFTECEEPIHLADELRVIERAIDTAATKLAMHECKSFIIASDHGASRLAVIRKKEEKYETDTKGEHSGRCCKSFDGCDLPHMVEEKGYFVLTDYGRFKGSRAANVEVHGGATLEEVVVPIISLKLKNQNEIDIRVLNLADLSADKKNGTTILLYISDVVSVDKVSIIIDGNKYHAKSEDATHYSILLDDIRRSKKCTADIYDGDDLIGNIQLDIKGKSGSVNKGFDDEFDF